MKKDEPSMDTTLANIDTAAKQIIALSGQAAIIYAPVVEKILRTGNQDVRHIERTLDGLLDFCGHGPVVELFRQLCRHYWTIDQAAAAEYVLIYRDMWGSELAMDSEETK